MELLINQNWRNKKTDIKIEIKYINKYVVDMLLFLKLLTQKLVH